MARRRTRAVIAAAVVAAGCVPATFVQVPAIRGRVVDPAGQPVGNATVLVVRDHDRVELTPVRTRADGTFSRPELSSTGLQFAGADPVLVTYSVTATAGQRRSPTTQVSNDIRRWFLVYYDPSTDRDLGTLGLR